MFSALSCRCRFCFSLSLSLCISSFSFFLNLFFSFFLSFWCVFVSKTLQNKTKPNWLLFTVFRIEGSKFLISTWWSVGPIFRYIHCFRYDWIRALSVWMCGNFIFHRFIHKSFFQSHAKIQLRDSLSAREREAIESQLFCSLFVRFGFYDKKSPLKLNVRSHSV